MQTPLSKSLLLVGFCIVLVLMAGCTTAAPAAPAVATTETPAKALDPEVTTIIPTSLTPVPTTEPITTIATPAPDPILHRWIRIISGTNPASGYELKFYPGGTVVFNQGTIKEVSSNIMISTTTLSASGTWTALGDNKYLVKINPVGNDGAPYVWEYTWVPAHEEPEYPGVVIAEHIESQDERDAIPKGRQPMRDEMFFPERAKVD
jgi:hypothetical protein